MKPSQKFDFLLLRTLSATIMGARAKTGVVALIVAVLLGVLPSELSAQTEWGNRYIYNTGGTQAPVIDSPEEFFSTRFTAYENLTVDEFVVNAGAVTGSPNMIVDVYSDDGSGIPGTLLASSLTGTLTANVKFEGTLDTSVNLVEGSVYHIVSRVSNGSVTDKVGVNYGSGSDIRYSPGSGDLDPSFNRVYTTNGGTSWIVATPSQVNATISTAVLRSSSTSKAMGPSIGTLLLNSASGAGGTATRGQEFLYQGAASSNVEAITLRLKKGAGDAAGDLRVLLLDSGNSVLSDDVMFTGGTFSDTSFDFHTVNLAAPVSLTEGDTYRLVLYSPDSTADSYESYFPVTLFSSGVEARGATFQGVDGFTISSNSGLTGFTGNTLSDMYFSLETSPVPEPSSLALLGLGVLGLALRRRVGSR